MEDIIMIVLNKKQKEAVEHLDGPMMVLAGPGSGKTTVITYRVKNLIQNHNIPPERILVITFTKAAANEMNTRFKNIIESKYANKVTFSTFHSVFFRIIRSALGYRLENVLKEDESKIILKNIINKLRIEYEDEEEFLKDISSEISLMKNELIDVKYYNTMICSTDDYRKIVNEYENYKDENNKIDFDDMLCICWKELNQNVQCCKWWQKKYDYILIDEFQDINRVQYETICLLSKEHNNLFIVGDDDQSIYKFRGARPEFLLKFPEDFSDVKTVILDINYRSTDSIIHLANKTISNNQYRYDKNIVGTDRNGKEPILINSENTEEEALLISKYINKLHNDGLNWSDIAVIFRTNIQARAFVDKFMDLNFPFFIKDEMPNIYDHWIAKDLLAYIKLSLDLSKNNELERIINKPKRYISKLLIQKAKQMQGIMLYNLMNLDDIQIWQRERIEELDYHLDVLKKLNPSKCLNYILVNINYGEYIKQYAAFRKINSKGLFEVVEELKDIMKKYDTKEEFLVHVQNFTEELRNQKLAKTNHEAITLTTMHGAKGLEFDAVFVISVVEGVIPHEKSRTADEIEEERRLFYVAITRAKRFLYISTINTRYEQKVEKSLFLKEIYTKLK